MRGRWMPRPVWAACLILAVAPLAWPEAQEGGAASGSFRAAQESGLDLSLRPVDLLERRPRQRAGRQLPRRPGRQRRCLVGARWRSLGGRGLPGAGHAAALGRRQGSATGFAAPLLSACRRRSLAVIPREDALTRADLLSKMTVRRLPGGGAACKKQTV